MANKMFCMRIPENERNKLRIDIKAEAAKRDLSGWKLVRLAIDYLMGKKK
jgi:hypothetical protein